MIRNPEAHARAIESDSIVRYEMPFLLSEGVVVKTIAISPRGCEYENSETDEQITALEGLMDQHRSQPGHEEDVFSWSSENGRLNRGRVHVGTVYMVDGDGVVNHRGALHEGKVWQSESWVVDLDGTVSPAE
jgi:hypothetical protein